VPRRTMFRSADGPRLGIPAEGTERDPRPEAVDTARGLTASAPAVRAPAKSHVGAVAYHEVGGYTLVAAHDIFVRLAGGRWAVPRTRFAAEEDERVDYR
jgi:hypothetical protein